jgi:hypothetical protein
MLFVQCDFPVRTLPLFIERFFLYGIYLRLYTGDPPDLFIKAVRPSDRIVILCRGVLDVPP